MTVTIGGFTSTTNELRAKVRSATNNPIDPYRMGMDSISNEFVALVANDIVEAGTTDSIITATAHSARVGDIIRFTSGALSGEQLSVIETTANTILLAQKLTSTPVPGVTFAIERFSRPRIDPSTFALIASSNQGLLPFVYDYISLSYTGADLTGVVFKTGGAGGTTVATLTLTYLASVLQTVTRT